MHLYLSCWYKRQELGFRAALFFSAAAFSGAFGGLLAAAIANLNGVAGLPGWAWIVSLLPQHGEVGLMVVHLRGDC